MDAWIERLTRDKKLLGRLRAQRLKPRPQLYQLPLGEAAAHSACIVQPALLVVVADLEGAEPATAAARR